MRILAIAALAATACTEHGQTPPNDGRAANDGVIVTSDATFTCADDSALEPNNSLQTAFDVPATTTISFVGLAICPNSDVDFYRVAIAAANKTLEVIVTLDAGSAPLDVEIENAAGTVIATSTFTGPDTIHAVAPNLPVGTFFVRVFAAGPGENNYMLTVNVTP